MASDEPGAVQRGLRSEELPAGALVERVRQDLGRTDTKKLVAERDLEIEVMKEVAAKKLVSVPAVGGKLRRAGARSLGAAGLHRGGAIDIELPGRKAASDAPVVERMKGLYRQFS